MGKLWIDFKTFIFFPTLIRFIMRVIFYTSKKEWIISDKIKDEPTIYLFWHGNLIMQAFFQKKYKHSGENYMINSIHKDGEIMVQTMRSFKLRSVRGSSNKGGSRALIAAIKQLKLGNSMWITPDGPKGPRHSISKGVVAMSQKLNVPLVCQFVVPSSYWELKTWDHFIIPKPFGKLNYIMTEPFKVTGLSMEEAKSKIQEKLLEYEI